MMKHEPLAHLSFGFDSSFVIRHSSSLLWH
jgi:hypothetical protein